MAPTGVAAQNIGGQTIHSSLRIHSHGTSYQTLAFSDVSFYQKLKSIKTLIIDEISMVQPSYSIIFLNYFLIYTRICNHLEVSM